MSTGSPPDRKQFFTTPNPFEKRFGYHRAVRKGPFIYVSGTTALRLESDAGTPDEQAQEVSTDSKVLYPDDAQKQARLAMERCIEAVENLGGTREDVVRVKMFVSVSSGIWCLL